MNDGRYSHRMGFFFQELVNGITTGALYSLVALGFSMVYGVLKLLNFAHGDLYMVGAFIGYFVIQWFGGPSALTIPVPLLLVIMFVLAAVVVGGLGVAIERFAYRPLRNAPRIAPLITAIGVSFFLENAALLLFGAQFRIYNTPDFISFSSGIQIGSVSIDAVQIMVLVLGIALMIGLRQLVSRTKLGKQMRAVAADREAAEMMGINVDWTIAATFFLGSALAGVAGVMAGLLFNQVTNTIGFIAGLKAFTAAVVGGIGSIPGAMLGGLLIGVAESFITGYISSTYTNLLVFALLIVVMLVRPTGLLDLGYIAFFGFGAYGFALLSSNQLGSHGIHLPAYLSLPIVMAGTAIVGLLVGLPSRRLIGDYLAIVTLFFGEAFVEFTNNVAPSKLGGPNGIVGIDTINAFGHQITTNEGYFYLLLVIVVLTMAVLRRLEGSRTGRGWRAVREDPLAAASMTIPVDRVKLMAFASGAMIAGLAGSIFAAQQISVFPPDFDTPYLILVYAGLVLGGAGSIAGSVTGMLVVMVVYDGVLRSPTDAGYIFYGLILLTLVAKLRPWRRLGIVLAATAVLGFAAHAIAGALSASAVAGGPQSTGWIADALRDWVIVPANPQTPGNYGFVLLVCLLIALVQLTDRWRTILLVPTIYLASFVWETRLIAEPSVTRQLMIGAILIVMMNARPQGLLGARRVEALT